MSKVSSWTGKAAGSALPGPVLHEPTHELLVLSASGRRGGPASVLQMQVLTQGIVRQLVHQHLVGRRAGSCLQGPDVGTVSP